MLSIFKCCKLPVQCEKQNIVNVKSPYSFGSVILPSRMYNLVVCLVVALLFHGVYAMLSDLLYFVVILLCHQSVSEFGKCLRMSVVRECKSNLAIKINLKSYLILYVDTSSCVSFSKKNVKPISGLKFTHHLSNHSFFLSKITRGL